MSFRILRLESKQCSTISKMEFTTLSLVVLTISSWGIVADAKTVLAPDSEIVPQLTYLGSTGGKSFFGDWTYIRNWTEAGDYCRSMNMELGTVTSHAEVQVLNEAYYSGLVPSGRYWTAARDALKPRQFSWNKTETEVADNIAVFDYVQGPELSRCLSYSPNLQTFAIMYCSYKDRVLCEVYN